MTLTDLLERVRQAKGAARATFVTLGELRTELSEHADLSALARESLVEAVYQLTEAERHLTALIAQQEKA